MAKPINVKPNGLSKLVIRYQAQHNITQDEMARRMGLATSTVSFIRRGKNIRKSTRAKARQFFRDQVRIQPTNGTQPNLVKEVSSLIDKYAEIELRLNRFTHAIRTALEEAGR